MSMISSPPVFQACVSRYLFVDWVTGKGASGNNSTLAMRNRPAISVHITTESSEGDILRLFPMINQNTDLQGFPIRPSTGIVR